MTLGEELVSVFNDLIRKSNQFVENDDNVTAPTW
jgi:hypothetical protein